MESWKKNIPLLNSGYSNQLIEKINDLRKGSIIFPPAGKELYALESTPFTDVKVVILGQDPYHGEGQAHGLAFSVPEGIKPPPSLKNIFKEINTDIYNDTVIDFSSDLTRWAIQGVLLLNSTLTVECGKAASHKSIGWSSLTDEIIEVISKKNKNIVFILWGGHAISKKGYIDGSKHLILEAPHPSPLSAYRGFFGCSHFSKANNYLIQSGKTPVKW